MEELVRLCAQPMAFAGSAVIFVGLIYLGIQLKDGATGGREFVKALALIGAGGAVTGFAAIYGFSGF